mmetsp:Transcript_35312/g.57125  ORF Transcript_35312/g.57125 Transcript_35312/m.57125 type:complete len:98 (+) Transcript_35312:438-731(+)
MPLGICMREERRQCPLSACLLLDLPSFPSMYSPLLACFYISGPCGAPEVPKSLQCSIPPYCSTLPSQVVHAQVVALSVDLPPRLVPTQPGLLLVLLV